jgi:branched-chain amino acid aminotransferase
VERAIDRSELLVADEVFITGSAAGVQWISSIDHRDIGGGERGPVAAGLIALYDDAVRGKLPNYRRWLTAVYADRKVAAS